MLLKLWHCLQRIVIIKDWNARKTVGLLRKITSEGPEDSEEKNLKKTVKEKKNFKFYFCLKQKKKNVSKILFF